MDIAFIKMEGAGNDYVYIDLIKNKYALDYKALSIAISSRHFGVGGDGLVLIMKGEGDGFRMRIFNADGSEAEMCGNAIRCMGKYLFDQGYIREKEFSIETLAGPKQLRVLSVDPQGRALSLSVDMGEPILRPVDIPVESRRDPPVGIETSGYTGTAVSMGNPHFVIFMDKITDQQVKVDGPKLERSPLFPKRVNVEFVKVVDRSSIVMRVWERGSGETLACGTGACAGAVAGFLNGLTSRKVRVKLPGGTLMVEWREDDNHVYLEGPAREVFTGVYHYGSS